MKNIKSFTINEITDDVMLLHEELKIDGESTTLALKICSNCDGKDIGMLYFNFGYYVLAHRVCTESLASKFADKIAELTNANNFVYGMPFYSMESDFIKWYIDSNRLFETDAKGLIHFVAYSETFYYEFILNSLPEISFVRV